MRRSAVDLVNGQTIPGSDILEPARVSVLTKEDMAKQRRTGGAAKPDSRKGTGNAVLRAPFPVVYEDDNVFVYEKPAGWVCASPNPKVKTTYSAVKSYLEGKTEERIDVHFVNKLPREASGLMVVAKSLEWRQHLQTHWSSFAQGMYVMVQGHLPADDELFIRPENEAPYNLPPDHACHQLAHLLKFKTGLVRSRICCREKRIVSIGGQPHRTPSSVGHPFVCVVIGPNDEVINVKPECRANFEAVRGGAAQNGTTQGSEA